MHECQTPLFALAEVEGDAVRLHFAAPDEAPTSKGFAGKFALKPFVKPTSFST